MHHIFKLKYICDKNYFYVPIGFKTKIKTLKIGKVKDYAYTNLYIMRSYCTSEHSIAQKLQMFDDKTKNSISTLRDFQYELKQYINNPEKHYD